ncbi:hypothetical protein KSH_08935 [Moraxella osloensis]|nr:YadA-like family protein [Moraxella osloensis]ATQ85917.1 hypothetical protein KSH_08935 [Moraxella osloensis]
MGSDAVAPLAGDIAIGVSSGSNVSQNIPTTIDAGGNVTIGNRAGSGSYSYSSVALGNNSGQSMGSVNVPQGDNTVVGSSSGNNVKGNTNTAIGWQVGSNIGSNTNTAVGARTGQNIAGANNVAFSIYSGNMVLGSSNISMGDRTGQFVGVHKDAVRYDTATKKFVDANGVAVATATGTNNIAMGSQAGSYVAGHGNFALGENTGNYVNYHPVNSAMVGGQGGNLAFGKNAGNYINGSNNIAFGQGAGAGSSGEILQRNNTINLGYGAIAYKSDALAFGNSAKAHTANSLSFGKDSEAGTAGSTTAINALAIGTGAKALAKNAISIGTGNVVSGENSGAIGDPSIINGANSYSVGNNNAIGAASQNVFVLGNEVQIGEDGTTNVSGAVALGHASDVIVKNGVALGSSSVADRDALVMPSVATTATVVQNEIFGLDSSTTEDKTAIQNTVVGNLGAVSVGSDTATRQITHVAAGSEDSDAVNVAQLKAVANTPLGFTDDADTQLTRKLGENLHVKGGAKGSLTDGNIGVVANGTDTLEVKLAEQINLGANGSVSTGDSVLNNVGLMITGGPSITTTGIDAGSEVISNVKAGELSATSTDAVNGSQLFQTNEELANLANKTAQALGGGASANQATGAISAPSYTVTTNPAGTGTKTTVSNVGAALTALDTAVNQPLSFAGDTGTQISRKLGETLNVKGGAIGTLAATGNIGVVANGTNQLDIRLAETINLGSNGSVTTGSASIKNNEVKVGTNTLTDTGLKAGNVRVNTSTNDVTGLSNTTWNPAGTYNSGRAATEEQLLSAQNQLNTTLTDKGFSISAQGANSDKVKLGETVDFRNTDGNLVATRSADNTINYDLAKNISVDKVTLGNIVIDKTTGINAGNQKITNVKAGDVNSTSTDAVNGSQLYTAQNNVKNVLGSSTQIDATGNLTSTNIGGVTGANTVHDAIQQVNNTATDAKTQANKGLNFAVNGVTPADNVQLGETVNFANGTNTTATYDAATNTYKYSLNDTLSLSNAGSLSIKDSAGTGTVVSVDKTGVQSGSIKLDASTGKITGVTDGLVAAGSQEAVNGGQLDAVKAIANTGWKLTTDKTGTGTLAGSSVEQITPDETVTFIAGDNIAVEQAGNKVTVATKKDVVFDSVTSTDILGNTSILSATGIITQDKDGKKSASLSNTGLFVAEMNATGNTLSSSSLEAGKLTVKGTNTLVLDSVKGTLTGLSNKTLGSGDFASQGRAATEEQLNQAQSNVASILGGNAANNGGLLSMSNIGGTGESTIDDAIKSVNQVANNANKGWNVSTNGGTANNVKPNDTIDFSNKDGNVIVSNQGNNIIVDLNKDIDLGATGSVTTGDTKIDNNGLTIAGGPSITKNGIDAGKQKVTNVADGKIAAGSQDAVNGGQIHDMMGAGAYDTNGNLSNIGGTGQSNINDAIAAVNKTAVQSKSTVTEGSNIKVVSNPNADGSTNYTVSTADDITLNSVTAKDINAGTVTTDKVVAGNTTIDSSGLSIKNGPSVTASGIDAGSKVVSNVSNGVQNSDAVNMGQLSQYLGGGAGYNNITQSFDAPNYQVNGGSYNNVGDALGALNQADQALGNRITNLGDQLQQAFYSTNQRIDDVEKKANAGIAAAMALENAPYIPGKYTYAAGAAYHGGENAIGLTLRKTADNGRWSLAGGVAAGSSGDPSVRVGISGVID